MHVRFPSIRLVFLVAIAVAGGLVAQTPTAKTAATGSEWWRHAVIYEVYPRSFQDSNGDGVGDLQGVTSRLDYLQELGVDVVWLSPMYPSPNVDFGYDISDYRAVAAEYGSLADMDRLIAEAKKRGIGIVLDGVFNHTSDQHPWFLESKSSRTNPKRDWYVWRDGKPGGGPPNNWHSGFTHGSAWTLDQGTGQFYYHNFFPQQPDLNWRNPAVENAIFDVMKFWMDRGVMGFRLDAVLLLYEDAQFRDGSRTVAANAQSGEGGGSNTMTKDQPELYPLFGRMRKLVDGYPGQRVLIGEDYLPTADKLLPLYGEYHDRLQLPMDMQVGFINKLDATAFRTSINDAETKLEGNQPLLVFDNHDKPRSWDRYGDGVHNDAIARLLATMLLTTRSTVQLYQGQELGMVTTTPVRREDSKDPIAPEAWPKSKGRDGERTPMQWDGSAEAGFTTGAKPWLPVPPHAQVNVAAEEKDAGSLLNWYKQLIALRRTNPALHDGEFKLMLPDDANVLAYARVAGSRRVVVACNFSAQPQTVDLGLDGRALETLAASAPELKVKRGAKMTTLPALSSWVVEVR